jgi:hypothetical protein
MFLLEDTTTKHRREAGRKWARRPDDPPLPASSFRSTEHENAYENVLEEEGKVRSTPM